MQRETLQIMQQASATELRKLRQIAHNVQAEAATIEARAQAEGFSRQHAEESIKKARERVLPEVSKLRAALHQRGETARGARAGWSDQDFQLSRVPFVKGDAAQDAVVRAAVASNLSRLPFDSLKLAAEETAASGNLALAYEARQAAKRVYNQSIDLPGLRVPEADRGVGKHPLRGGGRGGRGGNA